jgi:hypothetical protein
MPDRPELTPDPLAECLARFTPDATGLDRADLFFQAGRASVRGRTLWPAAAGLLLVTQVATIGFLLSREPPTLITPAAEVAEPTTAPPPPIEPSSPDPPGVLPLVHRSFDIDRLPPLEAPGQMVATAEPTLRAFGVRAGLRDPGGSIRID